MGTTVLIVGAGQAGAELAWTLASARHEGRIILVGDEASPPYERPPLSKKFLAGALEPDRLLLRGETAYLDAGIELRVGLRVVDIDRKEGEANLSDGTTIAFDTLVLATGVEARKPPIPGVEGPSVHVLRDLDDARRLHSALSNGHRLLVLGGGYLGLEAAATARSLGMEVTVLEAGGRLLARGASAHVSTYFEALHRSHGVTIRLGTLATSIKDANGRTSVEISTGERLDADVVLIAVGAAARSGLAEAMGADCEDGILVDEDGRSSLPGVYAIGDCARVKSGTGGRGIRHESVFAAVSQARRAAAAILGRPPPTTRPPYFWSEQFEAKLQIAGAIDPARPTTDVECDPDAPGLTVHRIQDGVVAGVETVGRMTDFVKGQRLIGKPCLAPSSDNPPAATESDIHAKSRIPAA